MENFKMQIAAGAVVLLILAGGFLAFSGGDDSDSDETSTTETSQATESNNSAETIVEAEKNIVELAQGTESLSTLVAAVVKAELAETLSGEGPFTVFAPTDDAFASALTELGITAEELLARDDLSAILTYHVVPGEVLSTDLVDGMMVETVQGGILEVSVSDAGVVLTDARGRTSTVTAADVDASNGVVHLVDTVVLP